MLRLLTFIVSSLPWRAIYFISSGLAVLLERVYRRKVVNRNLELAFPTLEATDRYQIRRDFYQNFTDVALEIVKGSKMSEHEFRKRITIEDSEAVAQLRRHNGPFLLYASHYCNWEWIAVGFGLEITSGDILYKPLHNTTVDRWVYDYRSRFGNRLFPADRIGKVMRHIDGFRHLGMIADQTPKKGNQGKVWADFVGVPTPFFRGIFVLPYLTQWPSYYTSLQRLKRGHYLLKVDKIGSPPYEKTDRDVLRNYISKSEALIAQNPANWLWTHNRWKYNRQDSEELVIFRDL